MDTSPPNDRVAEVLADLVAEALARGEAAEVPGLGTFRVDHRASHLQKKADGRVTVHPPQDVVAFDLAAEPPPPSQNTSGRSRS